MSKYQIQMNERRNGPKIKYIRKVGITNAINV
jgi:intergrase/recombinase